MSMDIIWNISIHLEMEIKQRIIRSCITPIAHLSDLVNPLKRTEQEAFIADNNVQDKERIKI